MHSIYTCINLILSVGVLLGWLGGQAEAQGANKFYTGPGNTSGYCPISACTAANCQPYQYKSGCAFDSPGTCTDCTGITAGMYFSSSGTGLTDACVKSPCTACPAGTYNTGCSASSAGSCVACVSNNLPANNYWKVPANATDACPYAQQTVCPAGQQNVGYNSTYEGRCVGCTVVAGYYFTPPITPTETCSKVLFPVAPTGQILVGANATFAGVIEPCPLLANGLYYPPGPTSCSSAACSDSSCRIGQYNKGCSGTNNGTCAPCTGANSSQIYVTKGGLSNTCQVDGCVKTCAAGQYVVGCGVDGISNSDLTCGSCTNAVVNVNYYVKQGGYTPGSCPTSNCIICSNGNYLLGCGGTASGVCTACSNTVY